MNKSICHLHYTRQRQTFIISGKEACPTQSMARSSTTLSTSRTTSWPGNHIYCNRDFTYRSGIRYTYCSAAGHCPRELRIYVPCMRLPMSKWHKTIRKVTGRVRERLHKRKLELLYQSSNRIQDDKWIQELAAAHKPARIRWSRVCTANQRTTKQCQPNWRLDVGLRLLQMWP